MAESIVRKFYAELKKGKFWGQKCKKCGSWNFPPKGSCKACGSFDIELKEISGEGKLIQYSVGGLPAKKFVDYAPYAYGVIKLKEGPVFLTQVRGVPMDIDGIAEWNLKKLPVDVKAKVANVAGMDIVIFEVKK